MNRVVQIAILLAFTSCGSQNKSQLASERMGADYGREWTQEANALTTAKALLLNRTKNPAESSNLDPKSDKFEDKQYEIAYELEAATKAVLKDPNAFYHLPTEKGVRYTDGLSVYFIDLELKRTFIFQIGWGDCIAGCAAKRQVYVEVDNHKSEMKVSIVGITGDEPVAILGEECPWDKIFLDTVK